MSADVPLSKFQAAAANPTGLLKALGETAVAASRRAFRDQSFAGRAWPEAYQGMEPRVRIANLVGDLLAGNNPPARVLKGRPAGLYSGKLEGSIAYRILHAEPTHGVVEVGSWETYADNFQRGARTTQPITPQVRAGLSKWLDKVDPVKGRANIRKWQDARKSLAGDDSPKATKKREALDAKIKSGRERAKSSSKGIREKVGFLFGVKELVTNSVGRPFVGRPPELEADLAKQIERYFKRGGA